MILKREFVHLLATARRDAHHEMSADLLMFLGSPFRDAQPRRARTNMRLLRKSGAVQKQIKHKKPYLLERDRAPGLLWPDPTRILRIRFWTLLKIARLIQQSSNRSENL
jgi:hypothetical protein